MKKEKIFKQQKQPVQDLEARAQGVFRLAGESQEDVVGKRPRGSDRLCQCIKRLDFVLTPSTLATFIPFI